jgi:hypothetical protein
MQSHTSCCSSIAQITPHITYQCCGCCMQSACKIVRMPNLGSKLTSITMYSFPLLSAVHLRGARCQNDQASQSNKHSIPAPVELDEVRVIAQSLQHTCLGDHAALFLYANTQFKIYLLCCVVGKKRLTHLAHTHYSNVRVGPFASIYYLE